MGYSKVWKERLATGLCGRCGAVRGEEGATWYCKECLTFKREEAREYACRKREHPELYTEEAKWARRSPTLKEKLAARREAGICTACQGKRSRADKAAGFVLCQSCREKRATNNRKRCSEKRAERGASEPRPMGGAAKLGGVKTLYVRLDVMARRAIWVLAEQDRLARERVTRKPAMRAFNWSRVVREAILRWEGRRECPTRSASHRLWMSDEEVRFVADARTLAIVERQKAARDGNMTATVCDMLVATAFGETGKFAVAKKMHWRTVWDDDDPGLTLPDDPYLRWVITSGPVGKVCGGRDALRKVRREAHRTLK